MESSGIKVEGRAFYVKGHVIFVAESTITDYIYESGKYFILVDSDELVADNNIFAYASNGDLEWRIEEPPKLHGRNYFTSIYVEKDRLCAYSKSGIEVEIDKNSGKFLRSELIK